MHPRLLALHDTSANANDVDSSKNLSSLRLPVRFYPSYFFWRGWLMKQFGFSHFDEHLFRLRGLDNQLKRFLDL